jgi:hypothetical protein
MRLARFTREIRVPNNTHYGGHKTVYLAFDPNRMSKNINATDMRQIFAMAQHAGQAQCYVSKQLFDLRKKPNRTDEEEKTLRLLETQQGNKVFAMRLDDSAWIDSHPS